MKLILQIALGVSLGIILGGSFLYLYTGAFAEQLMSAALKQSMAQNTLATPKSSAVDSVGSNNAPATTLPTIPTQSAMQPTSTIPAPIAEMNVAGKDTAVIADKEEQRQMAIKFKAYYKKPDKCQSPNEDHDLLVACGNEYIRAKAKFEELWQQGEFKQ